MLSVTGHYLSGALIMSLIETIHFVSKAWQPEAMLEFFESTSPFVTHLWATSFMLCVVPSIVIPLLTRNKIGVARVNSILSLIHAILGIAAGWYSLLTAPDGIYTHEGWANGFDDIRATLCDLSCGYFFYDLLYSLAFSGLDQAIHHFACGFSMSWCRGFNIGSKEVVAAMCIAEVSTPIMHVRRFLEFTKSWPGFNPFDWASLVFAIVFLVARCGMTPFVAYKTVTTVENPMVLRVSGGLVQLLSFLWAHKIIKIAIKAAKGDKSASNATDTFSKKEVGEREKKLIAKKAALQKQE